MAKQIFVHYCASLGVDGASLDDVPLFVLLPYGDWMIEVDVAKQIIDNFGYIFESLGLEVNIVYASELPVPMSEIARVTVEYARKHGFEFWWVEDTESEAWDHIFETCQGKDCLIHIMDSAIEREGWINYF